LSGVGVDRVDVWRVEVRPVLNVEQGMTPLAWSQGKVGCYLDHERGCDLGQPGLGSVAEPAAEVDIVRPQVGTRRPREQGTEIGRLRLGESDGSSDRNRTWQRTD
jgi:hypothetical protein